MIDIKTNKVTAAVVILSLASLVTACGGGDSDASEATAQTPAATAVPTKATNIPSSNSTVVANYAPDAGKLSLTAETTLDLYAETDFNFASYRQITFDLDIQSLAGENIADALVYVSAIPSGVSELDDPKINDKSLLTVLKTDSNGSSLTTFEVAQIIDNVLIEINALGVNNKHIINISEQNYFVLTLN